MTIYILLLIFLNLLVAMTFAGRAHGAGKDGFFPAWARVSSTILFGISFGAVAALHWGVAYFLLGGITAWAFSKGHGNFMHDGVAQFDFPDEPEWLEKWTGLHWLLPKLGMAPRSKWYCRVMMGVKGGLIAAPAFPCGLVLALLWPFAYAVCFQPQVNVEPMKRNSVVAEWLTGPFSTAAIAFEVILLLL